MKKLSSSLVYCFLFLISIPVLAKQPTDDEALKYNVVDLNHATVEQLTTLKGIGQKKAQAIIDYRTEHQGFKKLEELTNIKGIGDKLLKENLIRLSIDQTEETLRPTPVITPEISTCITPNK